MTLTLSNPGPAPDPKSPRKRRGVFRSTGRGIGWLAAGSKDWFGADRIRRGGSFIAGLTALLRSGPMPDSRFRTEDDGTFDLRATAFLYGIAPEELVRRLALRRRQTARLAYASAGLACVFLLGWLWEALTSPLTTSRLASLVEFLPFCALSGAIAFYNALLNFQIRTGRIATCRAYLVTDLPFLPR